ncbi:MAG: hypothetical protein COA53_05400 [Rhodobacteraceae bacterium]|nr:MAG: hypothetical protein COA53_05400 [Paracoccaceae bacterium]
MEEKSYYFLKALISILPFPYNSQFVLLNIFARINLAPRDDHSVSRMFRPLTFLAAHLLAAKQERLNIRRMDLHPRLEPWQKTEETSSIVSKGISFGQTSAMSLRFYV